MDKLTQEELKEKIREYTIKLNDTKDDLLNLSDIFSKQYYNKCFYLKSIIDTLYKFVLTEPDKNLLKTNLNNFDITDEEILNHYVCFVLREYLKYNFDFNRCNHSINKEYSLIKQGMLKALLIYTKGNNIEYNIINIIRDYLDKNLSRVDN